MIQQRSSNRFKSAINRRERYFAYQQIRELKKLEKTFLLLMKKFSNNNQISTANKNNEIDVICKFRLNIENRVGWKILEANISSSKKKAYRKIY